MSSETTPDVTGIADEIETITCEHLTCGRFLDEPRSCAYLDSIIDENLWRPFHEVRGSYMNFKPWQEREECKIDRILVPTPELIRLGWKLGPVGIECKMSNKKIGPCISQCLDYTNAIFEMPQGTWIVLKWVFLWPLEKQRGAIESVMAQHRIGSAWEDRKHRLVLRSGNQRAFGYEWNGDVFIQNLQMGRKVGTR